MTFSTYLRRRKSYTEAGQRLKAALVGLPEEVQTPEQVHAWLLLSGASRIDRETARRAAKDWRQLLRTRRAG